MRIVLQGGDNMLGRAIQLTLPHQTPGDEDVTDTITAKEYLELAGVNNIERIKKQNANGSYLWGDLLKYDFHEDLRIINIESACTTTIQQTYTKIEYHTNIQNIPLIFKQFNRPYLLTMANNHALDMGRKAFENETLPNVKNVVGVGMNHFESTYPYLNKNIAVFGFATECSGTSRKWAATTHRSGVAWLPSISTKANVNQAFNIIHKAFDKHDLEGKCIIITIHWGPNWSTYDDGQEYRQQLAYRLIDELGVSIIHGHSSHHIRGMEVYKGKFITYGAGDFVNDYEGISGHEEYAKAGAVYILDLDNEFNLVDLELFFFETYKLSCRHITDPKRIKEITSFVNEMSMKDCRHPLLI